MHTLRTLFLAGALTVPAAGALAQKSEPVRLAGVLNSRRAAPAGQFGPTTVDPTTWVSLRGGAMLSPRGAGLVGLDLSLPAASLFGEGWHGRLDADVIFKANFAGVDTIFPVTVNQVYYRPQVGMVDVYGGGGVGAIFGGDTRFAGKLLLGVTLNERLGVEGNVIFNEEDTMFTLFGRLHL